jgi:hypothetical protein
MQDSSSPPPPIEDDGTFVPPPEHVPTGPSPGPLLSAGSRKAAKRNFPFDLRIGETIQLVVPPIPARKKPRLGEHLPISTDEATTQTDSHATTVALPPPDAAAVTAANNANDLADLDLVMDYSIDPAAARTGKWTADEDKKLRDAAPAHGDKDWVAISAQVPGRTRVQCKNRWHNELSWRMDS